jgi:hypothetical protein
MASKLTYGQLHKVRRSVSKFLTIGLSFLVGLCCLRVSSSALILDLGDPTDSSIPLRPLEPASGQALARDLVLKTRRRKGLGDQIAVSKYLDDEFVVRDYGS